MEELLNDEDLLLFNNDLAQLFNKYGSDKDINGYSQLYHTLFSNKRAEFIIILEIGIGTMTVGVPSSMVGYSLPHYKPGGSLRAWRDYFIHAQIIGVDIQPDTQFNDEPRIKTYLCDSTKQDDVITLMNKLNIQFDIIIDDGLHLDTAQIATLRNFYPFLKENGIYIIEDIYPRSNIIKYPDLVKKNCNNDPFFFVGKDNNICVIYKNHITSNRKNY
jgi:hypothetical protein